MRQLFIEKGTLSIKEVCRPLLDDYSVLVSVSYSFLITGQELFELLHAHDARFFHNIPNKIRTLMDLLAHRGGSYVGTFIKDRFAGRIMPIGNSCSGRVVAVGKKVKRFRIGDLVACVGDGFANHAEIVCAPEQLVVPVPDESLLRVASLMGVGAIAMQSIRRASLCVGETVCVYGMDTLGQVIALLAKGSGCRVFALDAHAKKLEHAQRSGVERALLLGNVDVYEEISYATGSHGADCAIITPECMNDLGVNSAIDNTRKRGRIVLVGTKSVLLKQERVQSKEIDVLFSLAYGPGRHDASYEYQSIDYPYEHVRWTENRNMYAFMHLLQSGHVQVDYLLEKEVALARLTPQVVQQAIESGSGALITYKYVEPAPASCKVDSFIPARHAPSDKLNVTFFGAHRNARLSFMPLVKSIKNVEFRRIIDHDIAHALNAANQYIGAFALSGGPELFYEDPATDVVCVTSAHGVHVEHVLKALKNGKAVYLRQMLALTEDELARLSDFLHVHHQPRLSFGCHQSFAPFMQRVKQYVSQRQSPLMMNYRINLNALQDRETVDRKPRAGTIVATASHIFDLFCFLTWARPSVVSVEMIRAKQEEIFSSDNVSIYVGFDDGSLCSLQITSLGHAAMGAERMEVYFDGKSIVMEDFVRLQGYGLPRSFDEVSRIADHGQRAHVKQFFADLADPEKSILFDAARIETMARLTMQVDQLASQGGGEAAVRM